MAVLLYCSIKNEKAVKATLWLISSKHVRPTRRHADRGFSPELGPGKTKRSGRSESCVQMMFHQILF